MKILILGGTGAIGKHLVNQLSINSKNQIYVTSRKKINSSKINYVLGDAKNLSFLALLLNEYWDVIIDFMSYSTQEFDNRFSLLCKSTKRYIFLSSSRVYSNSKEKLNEESIRLLESSLDHTYLNSDEYALSKARQEDLLIN